MEGFWRSFRVVHDWAFRGDNDVRQNHAWVVGLGVRTIRRGALDRSRRFAGSVTGGRDRTTGHRRLSIERRRHVRRARGFRFRADAPLRVLGLAVADVVHDGITLDSDATGVDVSLWDDAGHQLVLAKVAGGTAAELRGDFRIVDLASPVLLEPGAYYRVTADMADTFEFDNGDHYNKATVTSTNYISMVQQADAAGTIGNGRAVFPTFLGDMGVADLGANLVVEVVPEPSTPVLLVASGATVLLSRRLRVVRRR